MKESDRIIELMKIERECVLRNEARQCSRDCANCDLAQNTDELIRAYDVVIQTMQTLQDFYSKDDEHEQYE